MKLYACLLAFLIAGTALAQDRLEKPVTESSTNATVNVTFTLGTVGYVDDIYIQSTVSGINTGTVYVVNNNHTNLVGAWVFTNDSLHRITRAYPVQQGDVVRCVFTASATDVTGTVGAWFKNVVH